jgi:hypothetical protein
MSRKVFGTSGLFGGRRVPPEALVVAVFFNMLMIASRSLGVVAFDVLVVVAFLVVAFFGVSFLVLAMILSPFFLRSLLPAHTSGL